MSSSFEYEIYFTGRNHPRDGCIVIGEDARPVFFEFETAVLSPSLTRTTIRSDENPVAAFDWGTGNGEGSLGIVTIGDREFSMQHLVMPGSAPNARRFQAADGRFYEWRRSYQHPNSYELYSGPKTPPIAIFRQFSEAEATPIGPTHGALEYSFTDGLFLLEALLALNLNRWLDWNTE